MNGTATPVTKPPSAVLLRLKDPTVKLQTRRAPWTIGPNYSLFVSNEAWKAEIPQQARTPW
jgi:hypothetical protein